jgi:hypothetical protein
MRKRAAAVHEALAKANFDRDVAALSDVAAARLRFAVHAKVYPVLDVTVNHKRPVRFRMKAPNWNEQPAAIEILKPDGQSWTEQLPGGVFNQGPHEATRRPFICMRGALEYHTHQSHVNEKWESYRGQSGMELVGILMQLAEAWRKANP